MICGSGCLGLSCHSSASMDRLRKAAMAGIAAFPVHTGKHGQGFYWLAREKPPGVASVQDADARLLKDGRRNRKTPMPTGDVEFRSDGDSSVVRGIGRFGWDAVRLPLLALERRVKRVRGSWVQVPADMKDDDEEKS